MRQSGLFTKISRTAPKDEISINAQLLARAGFVYKNSAGVYSYLPLGWRVIQKIAQIIREEMNIIGGQELFMPALVEKKYLDITGRWDVEIGFDVLGKKDEKPSFGLGWSHEEILAAIAAKYINSYKDLPFYAYQIQTKFRNEPRAKSGLLRGREFMMKDLYSFHASEEDLFDYYGKVADAYHKIFKRCGLKAVYTVAAGGAFTKHNTHEFQVLSDVGEDIVLICEKCDYAENKEISKLKEGGKCPTRLPDGQKCGGKISEKNSIEVGNIFPLGTKYSEAFNLQFADEKGGKKHVVMGSYGIGLGRLMATAVEVYHDKDGIIWPEAIAPFGVHLLELNGADAKEAYVHLQKYGIEVLYDDRDTSAGEKLVGADLMGIPWRVVASPKLKGKYELKRRSENQAKTVSLSEVARSVNKRTKA